MAIPTRLAALLVALFVLLPATVMAQGQTQADLNQTAAEQLAMAEKKLAATYADLVAKISPTGKASLDAAQTAWTAYRDKECAFETLGTATGSIHPMVEAECRTRLTRAHDVELKAQLHCQEGDTACGGQ